MSELLHANIFFVIASLATVVFCVLISLVLFQLFKILRLIRSIVERIEAGSEMLAEDVAHVRSLVAGGGIFSRVLQFFMGSFGESRQPKKSKRPRVN